jgi:tetratricopeptide (TPR) repeat protein
MDRAFNPRTAPNVAAALAHGRRLLGPEPRLAAEQAREILLSVPHSADAYRLLGEALRRTGEDEAANDAELAAIAASVHDPELMRAGSALVDNDLPAAEQILRPLLKRRPTDVAAIRMMAELAARIGRRVDAENLLRRAIELAPGWAAARANLATILHRQHRAAEALAELDQIERMGAADDAQRNLRAAALGRLGGYDEAIGLYRDVLSRHPGQPKVWMSLGHMLKTVGEQAEAIAAYRRAIELAPTLGEVWWSLANLKTVRFSDDDIAAMRGALAGETLGDEDRLHLHFALGKALEDRREDEAAFAEYSHGNRIRAGQMHYDPTVITTHVEACEALFTRDFLDERAGAGCTAPDPIFILGMPRAGSTLLEQILASHPLVEGTMELPDIIALSQRAGRGEGGERGTIRYPAILAELSPEELRALGQEYLDRTRIQRTSGKPFFIDKMPNNWTHTGFIRLILPNARIIDARRHPLACCFSNFKQHFARGQAFSYSLETVGSYYRDYVRLMAHFDAVMPGAVHRVIHETLVADPEAEIRRLLDMLGLPFDEACLRSHETVRPVRTASSEQVRRPISREGLDQWRRFEEWLGPLKEALGPALDHWDDAPKP